MMIPTSNFIFVQSSMTQSKLQKVLIPEITTFKLNIVNFSHCTVMYGYIYSNMYAQYTTEC